MNGVSRFLSRREKRTKGDERGPHHHHRHVSKDLYQVFHPEDSKKKSDKEEEKKIKAILSRLDENNIHDLKEAQVEYALRSKSANGDPEKAYEMLMMFEEALLGATKEPDRSVKLVGAENRELVTCYLDSLLFAMYARLDSFEQILTDHFADSSRKRLATMLRLWVNMLRSGNLITTDITKHLQEALGACGWEEAMKLHQQDVSEAFTFITDKLDLPLLTLKMDVYHTGKEDADDHKIVRERLLEVAIPPPPEDGSEIKLEDCLEAYFNNKIEVKRHLQRRNTLQSLRSLNGKAAIVHVKTVELRPASPSNSATPQSPPPPFSPTIPIDTRHRADSIFSERRIEVGEPSEKKAHDDFALGTQRHRASTIRREVLMPAWQFFSLIPWHTQDTPKNDVQVAHHFSTKRPVLGICLKRYSVTPQGAPSRLSTYIDIPLEIGLPHFISDDTGDEFGSNFTNFKLSLQSVVCHRGNSLDSGHYIALVRSDPPTTRRHFDENGAPAEEYHEDAGATTDAEANQWLRMDDLAPERVTSVDIKKALREEVPYLLFYQVQPIDDDLFRGDPPSYESISQPDRPSNVSSADPSSSDLTTSADTSHTEIAAASSESQLDSSQASIVTVTPSDTPQTLPISDSTVPSLELTKTRSINIAEAHLANEAIDVPDAAPGAGLAVRPHSIDLSTLERQLLKKKSSQDLTPDDIPRGRTSMSSAEGDHRSMLTFTDTTTSVNGSLRGGSSAPITPGDVDAGRTGYITSSPNNAAAGLGASRRNSRSWRNALRERGSRPSSATGEGRISFSMTRLRNAMSRDKLNGEGEKGSGGEEDGAGGEKEKEKSKANGTIRRAKSLRTGKKRARSRSGVRTLDVAAGGPGDGERPDRECVLM